ncbi:hypothetical protein L2E82_02217 [Cichorium intybus]|uniref:Uncharacterized protein n=1 Tax=Cichorium intybus TaxID=13427 RepID=A0ACB9H1K5_CICIN|nr:hypothetical protein L2E82_02217 [Cichorium intybus]
MLVFVPVELRQCVGLVELSPEHNKLIHPLLDFRSGNYSKRGVPVPSDMAYFVDLFARPFNTSAIKMFTKTSCVKQWLLH